MREAEGPNCRGAVAASGCQNAGVSDPVGGSVCFCGHGDCHEHCR